MLKPVKHRVYNGFLKEFVRTEDIKFSPSGQVLAIASTNGIIFLFVVDVDSRPVHVGQCMELRSTSLMAPHGIDFLSEDILAVANRKCAVTFYRIPKANVWKDRLIAEPIQGMGSKWFGSEGATRKIRKRNIFCGPESIRVGDNELFVCCNKSSTVTAHPYRLHRGTIETGEGRLIAQEGLEIPDGLALSHDRLWLAVSDHDHHRVVVYRCENRALSCVLRDDDLHYPHGLCFGGGGRILYVADAGSRHIHVFATEGAWEECMDNRSFKLSAVDGDAFRKTQE